MISHDFNFSASKPSSSTLYKKTRIMPIPIDSLTTTTDDYLQIPLSNLKKAQIRSSRLVDV